MRVVVVIPTYQEADNITTAIDGVRAAVPDARILVVDDSSPDGTAELARSSGVDVLVRPRREGLGAAYRAGWARALEQDGDVIVSMDADGSHDPAVPAAGSARVQDGPARRQEQPGHQRRHLEHPGLALEVVTTGTRG